MSANETTDLLYRAAEYAEAVKNIAEISQQYLEGAITAEECANSVVLRLAAIKVDR